MIGRIAYRHLEPLTDTDVEKIILPLGERRHKP